jgi:hypothetical protein
MTEENSVPTMPAPAHPLPPHHHRAETRSVAEQAIWPKDPSLAIQRGDISAAGAAERLLVSRRGGLHVSDLEEAMRLAKRLSEARKINERIDDGQNISAVRLQIFVAARSGAHDQVEASFDLGDMARSIGAEVVAKIEAQLLALGVEP